MPRWGPRTLVSVLQIRHARGAWHTNLPRLPLMSPDNLRDTTGHHFSWYALVIGCSGHKTTTQKENVLRMKRKEKKLEVALQMVARLRWN